MTKLAKSYLLLLGHNLSYALSCRQPGAQIFTHVPAFNYSEAQLAARFDAQAYKATLNNDEQVSMTLQQQILAHLDLYALIASDEQLSDEQWVVVCENGQILASNWQEQVEDILHVLTTDPLAAKIGVINLSNLKNLSLLSREPAQYDPQTNEQIQAQELTTTFSLEQARYQSQRAALMPEFAAYLEQADPFNFASEQAQDIYNLHGQKAKEFATINLKNSTCNFESLNQALKLELNNQQAYSPFYLIKVATVRQIVQQLQVDAALMQQQVAQAQQAIAKLAAQEAKFYQAAPALERPRIDAAPWHKTIAWHPGQWELILTDYRLGQAYAANPDLGVSQHHQGQIVLSFDAQKYVNYMLGMQIVVEQKSLGYDYVAQMPKFVTYDEQDPYTLSYFYRQEDTADFIPVALSSPSAHEQQSLANAWTIMVNTIGNSQLLVYKEHLNKSIALYRIFQALLVNQDFKAGDYFIVLNADNELAPYWKARLNQALRVTANLVSSNLMIAGSVDGATDFNYLPANFFKQSHQNFDESLHKSLSLLPTLSPQLYLEHDFYAQTLNSLVRFVRRDIDFWLFSKQFIFSYLERLRDRLSKVVLDPASIQARQAELQKQQAHTTQVEQEFYEQNSNYDLIEDYLNTVPEAYNMFQGYRLEKSSKIYRQLSEQVQALTNLAKQLTPHERQTATLQSLLSFNYLLRQSHGQNHPFVDLNALAELVDWQTLSDSQVMAMAAPLFMFEFLQITNLIKVFSAHDIVQLNPPLSIPNTKVKDFAQAQNDLYALTSRQVRRTNRQSQRSLRYSQSNKSQTPDYVAPMPKFLINLPQSVERKQAFLAQPYTHDFQIIPAVYGKDLSPEQVHEQFDVLKFYQIYERPVAPGEIGCTLSHMHLYQQVLADDSIADDQWILVCEDDTVFRADWYQRLNHLLHYLQTQNQAAPEFIQLNNNNLNKDSELSLEQLKKITFFNFADEDLYYLQQGQSIFFPHNVVSYGSSNYLFRKSLLRQARFINQSRPYWVADDFPQFFAFKPDAYTYSLPMLSQQNVEEFNSLINDDRENVILQNRQRLRNKELYKPLNFIHKHVIILQNKLTTVQIKQRYPEVTHIIPRADYEKYSDQELLDKFYNQAAYQERYKCLPGREEMILAIMHQEAYKYIHKLTTEVHNYFLVIEDNQLPLTNQLANYLNLVVTAVASRLNTNTGFILLQNTFMERALKAVDGNPLALPGHVDLAAQLAQQGRDLTSLPMYDEQVNQFGYKFTDYVIAPEAYPQYYVFGDQADTTYLKINPYLSIQVLNQYAEQYPRAYFIFSYDIAEYKVASEKISWRHGDLPNMLYFHSVAFATVFPPLFITQEN
ncbi:glycosyltransferase family 25 protein [Psittacicella hinzii]|nr:glycosyltransferase family 25 protein [Psittacicella hinzii]